MSEDSAESLLNQSATSEPAPSGDYQVMSDAYAEPPKKEKTFEGDDATAARAAAADQTGERMPSNQTVELGRAATDLERQRGIEKQAVENIDQELLKFSVDAVRQGHDPQQLLAQHVQQQQEQQQQQQTQPAEPNRSQNYRQKSQSLPQSWSARPA